MDLIDKSQFKYEYKCPEVREYKKDKTGNIGECNICLNPKEL